MVSSQNTLTDAGFSKSLWKGGWVPPFTDSFRDFRIWPFPYPLPYLMDFCTLPYSKHFKTIFWCIRMELGSPPPHRFLWKNPKFVGSSTKANFVFANSAKKIGIRSDPCCPPSWVRQNLKLCKKICDDSQRMSEKLNEMRWLCFSRILRLKMSLMILSTISYALRVI